MTKYMLDVGGRKFWFNDIICPVEYVKGVKDFNFLPDDVVLCGYPKKGTTWLTEMVWQIMHPDQTIETSISLRAPHLEAGPYAHVHSSGVDLLNQMATPRLSKSNLYPEFFEENVLDTGIKFVIMIRNAKDTLVSYYNFYKGLKHIRYAGSWDDFYTIYEKGELPFGDYFSFYEAWWRYREHQNVFFISYEELKADPLTGVKRVASFLMSDISEEQLRRIVTNTSIESMRTQSPSTDTMQELMKSNDNQFVRKGVVGDWVNYFTPEQSEYVDKLYVERFQPLGLHTTFQ